MTKEEFENALKQKLAEKSDWTSVGNTIMLIGIKKSETAKLYGLDENAKMGKIFENIDFVELNKGHDQIRLKREKSVDSSASENPAKTNQAKTEKSQNQKPIQERIKILLVFLNKNLYGKEEAVRLALLSCAAGESIFFLGLPGTAKSMISRRIASAFKNLDLEKDCFEYLMNEFSTPDEICGPVDLSALNEKPSRYARLTAGYLPSAKIAFLDEIWKSGPAILNTLLTIINEKKYHNGSKVERVPLVSLAAASNELPQKGLEALWDRFILRVFVNPVENEDDFFKIVDGAEEETAIEDESALLEIGEVEKWQSEIAKIILSDEAKSVISAVRKELARLNSDQNHKAEDGENYYISDRRWKKIVHILKASAFLNGRESVDLMDCSLIEHAIWNTNKQHEESGKIVEKILKQNGISASSAIGDICDEIDDLKTAVDKKWFNKVHIPAVAEKPAEPVIVEVGNRQCYKCIRDGTSDIWYVSVNKSDNWGNRHLVYDSDKEYYTDNPFSKNGNKIRCYFDFTIEMTKAVPAVSAKDYLEKKLFEPAAKKAVMESFDKEYYEPIALRIDSEIADLQKFRAENEKPFAQNAFANQKYRAVLLEKIDESIKALEDKKIDAQKQRERYASDANVKSNFALGDKICKDGTFNNSASDGEKIAEVCIIGKNYALSTKKDFANCDFDSAQKIANDFGGKQMFSAPYNSGWQIPTIEQWERIFANRKAHDFGLSGKYWSSTENSEKGGAWYFNFDTGEKELTLKSNEYKIALIRELV